MVTPAVATPSDVIVTRAQHSDSFSIPAGHRPAVVRVDFVELKASAASLVSLLSGLSAL